MKEERMWTYEAGADYTCPACEEEDLYFDEEAKEDYLLDIGLVYVDWQAHCPKCGRQFRIREVYEHTRSRIFELD